MGCATVASRSWHDYVTSPEERLSMICTDLFPSISGSAKKAADRDATKYRKRLGRAGGPTFVLLDHLALDCSLNSTPSTVRAVFSGGRSTPNAT